MKEIYLDYNATTPIDARVLKRMQEVSLACHANASSVHRAGQEARFLIESSREIIAAYLKVKPHEIFFTSGATEANNLILQGVAQAAAPKPVRLLAAATEHPSILEVIRVLSLREGIRGETIRVDANGHLDREALETQLKAGALLLSVSHVNHETGSIQDIPTLARLAHRYGCYLHVDAAQSFGKLPINIGEWGCDFITFSAHKCYGPGGVGGFFARSGLPIKPLFYGGSQEKNLRPGTENVAGIAGMARSLEIAIAENPRERADTTLFKQTFLGLLREGLGEVTVNGGEDAFETTLNVRFKDQDAEMLMMDLDLKGVRVSMGSACTAGSTEPSHVLLAMGLKASQARGSLRFSFGRGLKLAEIEEAARTVVGSVRASAGKGKKDL